MKVDLIRVASLTTATFGVLKVQNVPIAITGELPWENNQRNISCIPVGRYVCKRKKSPKYGDVFEVCGVQERSHILFHAGNIPTEDSKGCILIAEKFDTLYGKLAVLESRKGYKEFMDAMKDVNRFLLNLVEIKT